MKSYGIVYTLTCSATGKQYVGQTVGRASKRRWTHFSDARNGRRHPLSSAIRKYGESAFAFQVLVAGSNKAELDDLEDFYISTLRTLHPGGYNLRRGGAGGKFSEAAKAAQIIRMNNIATVAKCRAAAKRGHAMIGAKERRSAAIKQALSAPDTIAAMSTAQKILIAKPGFLARRGMALKIAFAKPDVYARRSAAQKKAQNHPHLVAASVERLNSPAAIAKRVSTLQGRPESVERLRTGRNTRWISDGFANKRLKEHQPMPAGWSYGKTDRRRMETADARV